VSRVSLKKAETTLTLNRDNEGRWTINAQDSFPASAEKVLHLLEDVSKAKAIEQVASVKEKWAELELENGSQLTFSGDKNEELFNMTLGKNRTSGGQYARFGDKPESYLIFQPVFLNLDMKSWELRTLIDLKKGDMKQVSFQPEPAIGKKPAVFVREKKEDRFSLKDSPGLDKEKAVEIDGLENLLSGLSFTERAPLEPAIADAFPTASTLEAQLFNGAKVKVQIAQLGTANDKKAFVRIQAEGGDGALAKNAALIQELSTKYQLQLDQATSARLLRGLEDFIVAPEPGKG
jgi:hypothetical protein